MREDCTLQIEGATHEMRKHRQSRRITIITRIGQSLDQRKLIEYIFSLFANKNNII